MGNRLCCPPKSDDAATFIVTTKEEYSQDTTPGYVNAVAESDIINGGNTEIKQNPLITSLPDDMLIEVVKKIDSISFIRFYQTTKDHQNFIEHYQSCFRKHLPDHVLLVKPDSKYRVLKSFAAGRGIDFCLDQVPLARCFRFGQIRLFTCENFAMLTDGFQCDYLQCFKFQEELLDKLKPEKLKIRKEIGYGEVYNDGIPTISAERQAKLKGIELLISHEVIAEKGFESYIEHIPKVYLILCREATLETHKSFLNFLAKFRRNMNAIEELRINTAISSFSFDFPGIQDPIATEICFADEIGNGGIISGLHYHSRQLFTLFVKSVTEEELFYEKLKVDKAGADRFSGTRRYYGDIEIESNKKKMAFLGIQFAVDKILSQ